ncbi:MAG TPA: DUF1361 domain-containing protein [Verrucomicrobiae bacterium]|nr:DUF1361 domain-containing protein [Verrucomicrobiae bacterium]
MRLLRIVFRQALKRETAAPMLALGFASATGVALVLARIGWTKNLYYGFLIWNLFLAWLPLVFALLACGEYRNQSVRRWRFFGWAGAWLLFFPNAPYIFTDLIHLTTRFYGHFWVDLILILLCAFIGLMLGFVSLYLMQSLVSRMFGRVAGWCFVAGAAGLSSVGVYLGRFLRFNSWDVFFRPIEIVRDFHAWMGSSMLNRTSAAFLALFAIFLFLAYLMLYALTHLSPAQPFEDFDPESSAV